MDIEIVDDEMPAGDQRKLMEQRLDMLQKILFGPRRFGGGQQDLPRSDIATEDERLGTMPEVLKLTPFHLPRLQRQPRVFAFQRLHTGQFVAGDDAFAWLAQPFRLAVERIEIVHFLIKIRFVGRREPIAEQVRLEIPFFLKASPHAAVRSAPQSPGL